jgi:hypothetical protein
MKGGPVWAIACLFNPQRYRVRAANFREFRRRLEIPLVAAELSFDGTFELGVDDAEVIVQVHGGDVMWQKERLLNLARVHLPAECEAVAVLDADVVFTRSGWSVEARERLRTTPVAQLFSRVHHLARGARVDDAPVDGVEESHLSVAWAVAAGKQGPEQFASSGRHGRGENMTGFAWGYSRAFLDRHGLYDGSIIGGGDTAMSYASWGRFADAEGRHGLTGRHRDYYRAWADPWFADVRSDVACVEGDLFHLAHGSIEDRRNGERHRILVSHGFDPFADLAPHPNGTWRWASEKPALHAEVARYFRGRREDG